MSMSQILVVDDEDTVRESIAALIEKRLGHEVTTCKNISEAIKVIKNERFDLIITDMQMPLETGLKMDEEGGLQVIRTVKESGIQVPIIVMTGYGTIENAVDAMRLGAFDYLQKPPDFEDLQWKIQRALKYQFLEQENLRLSHENVLLREQIFSTYGLENIIGESKAMHKLKEDIRLAAYSDAIVLIQGESGTGKELVANAIHYNSLRADRPFIILNCAAFPRDLIDDELFGHRRGSFSSAIADRKGAFEEANGGSLFLDEIGEMPLEMQPRLLRVLEQKEVKPIGENITRIVDVRVIAATNKNLRQEKDEGRFRPDLFERLNVLVLNPPPLKQIKEDIPLLVEHFIRIFQQETGKRIKKVSSSALDMLTDYDWPGNVRELKNVIERTILYLDREVIQKENIRMDDLSPSQEQKENQDMISIPAGSSLDEIKLEAVRQTLEMAGGKKTEAARILDISTSTFWKMLGELKKK